MIKLSANMYAESTQGPVRCSFGFRQPTVLIFHVNDVRCDHETNIYFSINHVNRDIACILMKRTTNQPIHITTGFFITLAISDRSDKPVRLC